MGVWIETGEHCRAIYTVVAPYAGAWINKRVTVVSVVYKPFYVREKFTFFLRVLSMYLTSTDLLFPSFSGFFALFGGSRRFQKTPLRRGVD